MCKNLRHTLVRMIIRFACKRIVDVCPGSYNLVKHARSIQKEFWGPILRVHYVE